MILIKLFKVDLNYRQILFRIFICIKIGINFRIKNDELKYKFYE